jgi:hypothetical protein
MEGIKIDIREIEQIAESVAKQMQGSVLQLRGGTDKSNSTKWEFWIEVNPDLYRSE